MLRLLLDFAGHEEVHGVVIALVLLLVGDAIRRGK